MKRAILVTTSTVVGVAAVLGYKPNSETAQTLLDITGANNTASTTSANDTKPVSVPNDTQPSTAPTSAASPTATTKTTKSAATPTPKASAKPTATSAASPTSNPQAAQTKTGATKTITGDAVRAISHGHDYGTVTVTVTLVDGKMQSIDAIQNPEGRNYPYIQAVRQYLIPAVLQAQKANVGYVQGATGSSEAFAQSLQSALDKA